ncbi:lrrc53 [Pungitius sinensis]
MVLELTQANCVPSNQNITVRIEAGGSVTLQRYAQDVAITAVVCFTGGVCLTLLVVLIVYQVSRSKKLKQSKRQKEEEERSSTVETHRAYHRDVGDKRRELFWQAQRSQPWDSEAMTIDAWTEGPGGQLESRTDGDGDFRCPDCSSKGQRGMGPKPMRWNVRTHGKMETEEEREMRGMVMEEKRRLEQGIIGRVIQDKVLPQSIANSSSHPRKETFAQRPEALAQKTNIEIEESNRTDMEGRSREHETLPCESCHRMSRRQGRIHFEGVHPQYRQIGRGSNVNHNGYDVVKNTGLRRETRNVTFDLESSRSLRRKYKREEEVRSCQEKERGKRHKAEVQSSRSPKVKLNLKPLGKIQVHPKMKTELGHSEKVSSKRSKDKRQEAGDRGDREAIGKPGKKTKEKTLNKRPNEDREEENEAEDTGEGGQENKQEKGGQGNIEDSHHDDTANTAHPSACALPFGQGQMLQGQGNAQHPVCISGPNHTNNRSLLGSSRSQPTGSSLSLQGGNFLVPTGPAKSVAPLAISGPNMAPSGATDSIIGQHGFSLMSPATSHLADTVNTLQASAIQNSPLPTSQAAGLALSVNPPVDSAPVQSLSQSKPPPDNSPLVAGWKTDPVPGSGFSTGVGVRHNLPTQAPLSGDGLSEETPPGPVTTVESLSNINSQTETEEVHAGPTALSLTEGPAAELSGGSMQGADVSESGVSVPSVSTQSVSSTGDAAAALLQQEYLSEEGGSSPRRKLRLVLPEKTSSRPPTALERKIR